MKTKVLGIAGSPRKGNTEILVKESLSGAEEIGDVETEFISIRDYEIKSGCTACYLCRKKPSLDRLCLGVKDGANLILEKMLEAEGLIIGTPVYWGGVTAQIKSLIDRTVCVEHAGLGFRNKVGAAVVAAATRNGGLEYTIAGIHHWMHMHDMIVV
jgi:multimeric flavodoxin WrbA